VRQLVAVVAALALALPGVALADGDPASDVLLSQDDFLPYAPPVSNRLETALKNELRVARTAGYPMKVALIESANDLGAYPNLLTEPQRYADLLVGELRLLNPHNDPSKAVHLLVVTGVGFGGSNLGDGVDKALAPIRIQANAQSDGLVQAAMQAVARIASANGHHVATPSEATGRLSSSHKSTSRHKSSPLVFAAPALLLFAALFVAGRVSARRGRVGSNDG